MKNAVIVSAVRTPVGKRGGVYKSIYRLDLTTPVIQEALKTLPFGDIWNEYCARQGAPADDGVVDADYETVD